MARSAARRRLPARQQCAPILPRTNRVSWGCPLAVAEATKRSRSYSRVGTRRARRNFTQRPRECRFNSDRIPDKPNVCQIGACLTGCRLSGWIFSLLDLESTLFVSSRREARNRSAGNREIKLSREAIHENRRGPGPAFSEGHVLC